uniref:Peptidase A1 domain-containing protein n=1 Tax=Kalanchoe fedtschenkoi TaxID=63787 RepID=A0A7N0V8H5_KALFE
MATYTASCCFLDSLLIFSVLTAFSAAQNISGFTANLYQRDAFYNPNLSQTEMIRRAVARSVWRANMSSSITPNSPTAVIIRDINQFFMKIRLGTPPVDIIAVVDTGSDLTWTQCLPCTRCFPQRLPLFNIRASSSYGTIQCGPSWPCPPWNDIECSNGLCHHDIHYFDGTHTRGLLSKETLWMDSTAHSAIQIPNYIFGCGMDNIGNLLGTGSGVIGLGPGPESIVTQLGHLIGRKFSYCLMPLDPPGRVTAQNISGFTANLYQRDAFYNPNLSQTEMIRRAVARSVWRANMSSSITPNSPTAVIIRDINQFFMKIRLGTPPVDIIAVVDTGSDLTWTQCLPCTRCFPQRLPLFNIQASSSYGTIQCGPSWPCPPWNDIECSNGLCHHDIHYFDGTHTRGLLSKETLWMDSTAHSAIQIPNYIFGCGMDNIGNLLGTGSGVIGLGPGPESIVTQLGHLSGRKFSYCLMPLDPPGRVSHIHFGDWAAVRGPGTIMVPLVPRRSGNFYHVTLEAFTVGRTRIPFTSRSGSVEQGNIIIDSGTALTNLPRYFYAQIKQAVTMQTHAPEVPDPYQLFELCFRKDRSLQLPSIVANFRGGNVPLKRFNVFVTWGSATCLAFGVSESFITYGSLAQQDFLVGFDQYARTVSFKPFQCSRA